MASEEGGGVGAQPARDGGGGQTVFITMVMMMMKTTMMGMVLMMTKMIERFERWLVLKCLVGRATGLQQVEISIISTSNGNFPTSSLQSP